MAIKLVKGNSKSRDIFFNNLTTIKNIQRIGDAIIVNFKNGDKYIYENFDILSKDTNFNNKSNFLDYINSLKDQKDILTVAVNDTSTLKDTDLVLLSTGVIDYVKNIDLSNTAVKNLTNDNSCVAYLPFDGDIEDKKGNFTPKVNGGEVKFVKGKFGQAVESGRYSQIEVGIVNKDSNISTVSAWLKWNRNDIQMPFSFKNYALYFYSGHIGFSTFNGDLYGFNNKLDWTEFHHFVVEFHEGEYGRIWVDGVEQELSLKTAAGLKADSATVKNVSFYIFGREADSSYRYFGDVDEVYIFNRALTASEISTLYKGNITIRKLNI